MRIARRTFLAAASSSVVLGPAISAAIDPSREGERKRTPRVETNDDRRRGRDLVGQFGITTGSFMRNLSPVPAAGKLVLLDLPKIMRDELDMKVIDLMTRCLPSLDADYCERLRNAAEKAGRTITNLKLNLEDVDIASTDDAERRRSIDAFKKTIDAAERLGCRWVRPAPTSKRPDIGRLAEGLKELVDYAGAKDIGVLVENNGWISRDPDALPQIVAACGGSVAVQPDTGNWADDVRYAGLEKAFPLAVTCDFKAFELGADGSHTKYDLRRCFDIAWKAGFRGPWCFEHFNADLPSVLREFVQLKEMLTRWTKEKA